MVSAATVAARAHAIRRALEAVYRFLVLCAYVMLSRSLGPEAARAAAQAKA